MNRTLLFVIAALVVGFLVGNSGRSGGDFSSLRSASPIYVPSYTTSSDREAELKEKLESARNNLENALSSSQDLEDRARMRWIQTGNINDMMRMHAAEDATRAVQDAIDDLDD
jgi:hypothetical protein